MRLMQDASPTKQQLIDITGSFDADYSINLPFRTLIHAGHLLEP